MNFEGKNNLQTSSVIIKDRKSIEITGVKKLESLNSDEFLVVTNLGVLLIKGEDLEMGHLDIEKGILLISGILHNLSYLDGKTKKEHVGFFGKVFK